MTKKLLALLAAITLTLGAIYGAMADEAAERQSYTTRYNYNGVEYRSVMFPHEVDGCKILIQSKRWVEDDRERVFETEGADCNCDLIIDGREGDFFPATGYASRKLLGVCNGPGVDGNERRLRIMRESLKEYPDFSEIPNVRTR
ncbi:MAG: hypothetical protein ACRBEQ_06580 [Hyphomonas sp.]